MFRLITSFPARVLVFAEHITTNVTQYIPPKLGNRFWPYKNCSAISLWSCLFFIIHFFNFVFPHQLFSALVSNLFSQFFFSATKLNIVREENLKLIKNTKLPLKDAPTGLITIWNGNNSLITYNGFCSIWTSLQSRN